MRSVLAHDPIGKAELYIRLHFSRLGIGKFLAPPDQSQTEQFGFLGFSTDQYAIRMTGSPIGFQIPCSDRFGYPVPILAKFPDGVSCQKNPAQEERQKRQGCQRKLF